MGRGAWQAIVHGVAMVAQLIAVPMVMLGQNLFQYLLIGCWGMLEKEETCFLLFFIGKGKS